LQGPTESCQARKEEVEWTSTPKRMYHLSGRLSCLLFLLLGFAAGQSRGGDAAEESPKAAAVESKWRALFNGKDLTGWAMAGTAQWRVEDGVIVGGQDGDPKRAGVLYTQEQFQDFEIDLEFIIDEHGKYNSGVYLRVDPAAGKRDGYQINIGRGAAEEYCGGLYTDQWLAKGDEEDKIRRKLDWNRMRILAKGGHIEVVLNGIKIVDFTDAAPAEKLLKPGAIALQTYGAEGHAGWVKFRNIRIRAIE
jgi:hypothetical protein